MYAIRSYYDRDRRARSDIATPCDGAIDCSFINVFQLAPHRDPVGQPGDAYPEGLDQPGQVERRDVPLDGEVGGDQHFLDRLLVKSRLV